MFFWLFILLLIVQRISELFIARKNEVRMRARGALEYDTKGYRYIVIMHVLFIISLVIENSILEKVLHPFYPILLILFFLTQVLRYWSIATLGIYWNTRILILPGAERIRSGPYRYLSHPNYLAVCLEFLLIPLIFSCYITAICFSLLNAIVLRRRITIEEDVLERLSDQF